MIRFLTQIVLLTVVFIAAWRSGGKPERYVATIYFSMLVASGSNAFLGGAADDADYENLHVFRFMLDLSALFGVVLVALRYDRWWTLWVGAVQFIAVMAHLLRALEMPISPLVYAVMERWPVWMALLLTGLGTYLHSRRAEANSSST